MLAAKTPLDLVGMAGDFVADELLHVELASRLAMEIGGGAPIETDFAKMGIEAAPGLTPRERANELVLRVGCIAETMSGAIAVETMREVEHPLVTKIMERIARDSAGSTWTGRAKTCPTQNARASARSQHARSKSCHRFGRFEPAQSKTASPRKATGSATCTSSAGWNRSTRAAGADIRVLERHADEEGRLGECV